jgi:hypothetical protein
MWEGTATLLRDNLFKIFGLPDEMIFDRDPRFAAHTFQELLKLLNIKSNLTTAYHSQTDGAIKRVNQEIETYLSIYCTSHPEDWLHSLSTLEFTHNNRRHTEQIHSPFELIQGDNVRSWQQNDEFWTPEISSERTWPQLMCCALVAPKGPNFRRTIKAQDWEERLRRGVWIEQGWTRLITKLNWNNTGVWLYILAREVRPISIHIRKTI